MTMTITEPRSCGAPSKSRKHLSVGVANRLAKHAGASDVDLLASYLVHCVDASDADRSLAALQRNQPRLFRRLPRR